ncbi:MAG: hypothetical protein L0Y78_10090 [candidate division NC10 bacterium]|nr:hypothetical protein [candidate division NC10 bacterium]
MKQQIGIPGGIEEPFKGKPVFQWIREGGTLEDAGTGGGNVTGRNRYFRHFHDPLLPWDRSGLFYSLTLPPRLTRFESSVHWAQLENQDSISGFGNFSWRDARRYFRTALTDPAPAVREQAFADTFRTLGQIMHLIEDVSVPEHVRNDIHPMGEVLDRLGLVGNYEYWVLAQHRHSGTQPGFIRDFLSTPMNLDEELLRIPIPDSESVAQVPIARLFDSDRYTGDNPEVTAESRIGIAEIANANFFSEDTHRGEYPHPALANLETFTRIYSQNGQERTYYRKRVAGLAVEPIAAECALADPTQTVSLCPDEDVWRETARHMLPRAVRYSRALLDYFFRGTFDFLVSFQPQFEPDSFATIITNTSGERMEGTFTAYIDDTNGVRSPVEGASFDLSLGPGANSSVLAFPLSPPASERSLLLVFQGRLGNEEGAVAAKIKRVGGPHWVATGSGGNSIYRIPGIAPISVTMKFKNVSVARIDAIATEDQTGNRVDSRRLEVTGSVPDFTTFTVTLNPPIDERAVSTQLSIGVLLNPGGFVCISDISGVARPSQANVDSSRFGPATCPE